MDKKADKGFYTILGPESEFEGTIRIPHSLRIDGLFKGKIETTEMLTIGNKGQIFADIMAKSAIIGGKVTGNIIADERVELESCSSLEGDLRTKDLVINEGAVFHGRCAMKDSRNG
jgi:cytoskeletal protein CcmA (bactofilin family)